MVANAAAREDAVCRDHVMNTYRFSNSVAALAVAVAVSCFGVSAEAAIILQGFEDTGSGGAWTYPANASVSHTADTLTLTNAANNNNLAVANLGTQTGDIYIRFTLTMDAATLGKNDFFTFWFNDAPTYQNDVVPAIGLKGDNDTNNPSISDLIVRIAASTRLAPASVGNLSDDIGGFTVDIVGRLSKNGGSVYNLFQMWVNPDPGSLGAPDISVSSNAFGKSSVNSLGIRIANLGNNTLEVSNLIVATTAGDLAPEPASLAIWGLGGLVGLIAARKRLKAA